MVLDLPGMRTRSRGISPVIGTVLLVAIVVVLAAAVSALVLGLGDGLRDPGPDVGQSSGELEAQSGTDGGVITITHEGGEPVSVEDLEIAVDATDACGDRDRLVDLPENDSNNAGRFADSNVESGSISDSIVDAGTSTDLKVLDSRTGNRFEAGTSLQFRLESGECPLSDGDTVVVRVVHTPSNSVIIEKELVV